MKSKLFLLVVIATLFIGCSKNEPSNKSGSYDNPDTGWNAKYVKKGAICIYNTSKYFTYQVKINGTTYTLKPSQNTNNIYLSPGEYSYTVQQITGFPTEGKYKNMVFVNEYTANVKVNTNQSFSIPEKFQLKITNTNTTHRYTLRFNGAKEVPALEIGKNTTGTMTIDMGYYYITAEQLDVKLWDSDYATSIILDKSKATTIQNWQGVEL